jgi:hypothetical protein
MSLLTLRPTFRLVLAGSPTDTAGRLQNAVRQHADWQPLCQFYGDYAEFHINPKQTRYWSPHLGLHFEPYTDATSASGNAEKTMLIGRFGPRQEVWMWVLLAYLALSCLVFFAAMYACTQWVMGTTPTALWGVAGSMIGIALLHVSSQTGQNWSADQMAELRKRLDQLLFEANIQVE